MQIEHKEKSPNVVSRTRQRITEFREWDEQLTKRLIGNDIKKFFFWWIVITAPAVIGTGQILQWVNPK